MNDQPIKWGDAQQYHAEPHDNYVEDKGVMPTVTLLHMTEDPLGSIGAMAAMYEGRVIRDKRDLSDEDRRRYWNDAMATHLKAPLEAVDLHFMVEGVSRSFTHQMVRQRTAVFAQESLRFAIPGRLAEAHVRPPSIQPNSKGELSQTQQRWTDVWDNAIDVVDAAYHMLVETGMPAEEARELLPHGVATRLNFKTNLRNLADHAGNRLCTQAQFHWRSVFSQIVNAIRTYPSNGIGFDSEAWQYETIADSALFRPVCYQLGHCPFNASFDRGCTIRSRVDTFAEHGVPSSEWHNPDVDMENPPLGINPAEWLVDPGAART